MQRKMAIGVVSILLIMCGAYSGVNADTVLFPVLAMSPAGGVVTVVSVTNQGPSSGHLLYSYSYKSPNYGGGCSLAPDIVRNDFVPDLVSFDASGLLAGGTALFNDADASLYGGPFSLPVAGGPWRGYLLVSNSDASGNSVSVGSNYSLRGEAILMDIISGSAWGYKAINDQTREDFSFYSTLYEAGGLVNVGDPGVSFRFTFFDLASWTTRFFVTPIGYDLYDTNRSTTISLQNYLQAPGINGRAGDVYTFDVPVFVSCTAAVNLTDLMDSTTIADLYFTGGWGRIVVTSGDSAVIYKLEYTFSEPYVPPGASNNNGVLVTNID
ncbi:MAG: hypothetical protein ACLPX5_13960 [Dissulfurispiraceae bacterium]